MIIITGNIQRGLL